MNKKKKTFQKKPKKARRHRRDFNSYDYKHLKKTVSLRDNRQCLMCKYLYKIPSKGRVNIHHLWPYSNYPEYRYDPKKCCVLCFKHHKEITGYELSWIQVLSEFILQSEIEFINKYGKSPYA